MLIESEKADKRDARSSDPFLFADEPVAGAGLIVMGGIRTGFSKASLLLAALGVILGGIQIATSLLDGGGYQLIVGIYLIGGSVGVGVIAEISLNLATFIQDRDKAKAE